MGIDKIKEYSVKTNNKYRIIFSFADIPKMEWENQKLIYEKCLSNDIQFGLTLTLVDENFNYFEVLDKITELNKDVILDLTLDPIRLLNSKFSKYRENINKFIEMETKKHIQILLSSYILEKYSPKDLCEKINFYIKGHDLFMAFSPTIQKFNIEKMQKYDFETCINFVEEFYNSNENLKEFVKKEIERNKNNGSYEDFMKLVFHLDTDLNVYNQVYSLYGDLIQDKRNFVNPLGNLKQSSLYDILNSNEIKKISIKNKLYLSTSEYNCDDCEFLESCNYNGIGLAINLYKKNKRMLKYCYGPKNFNK